jgi:peptidyl-tRNA hydrolase
MNDCSKLVKLCGLKSVIECANYCGTSRQEIGKAFNNNREKFNNFVIEALKEKQFRQELKLISDFNNLKALQEKEIKRAKELLK